MVVNTLVLDQDCYKTFLVKKNYSTLFISIFTYILYRRTIIYSCMTSNIIDNLHIYAAIFGDVL